MLEAANVRLQDALVARVDAFDRERTARAAAERASELQDRFLATVSHELRTPLNAIVGWAQVLKGGSLAGAELSRAVEGIERNARAQSKLIADLLDVSELIRGRLPVRMVVTDVQQPVRHAVDIARPAAADKGLQLAYAPANAAVPIVGDAERIEQIVANLLSNAFKFTPRGGHVDVKVVPERDRVAVQVSDSGEGIAAADFQHLFEPFFQADTLAMRAGLGVGLAIVKELVALHGGNVAVSSEGRGCGSTFAVTFPLLGRTNEGATWPASSRRLQVPASTSLPRGSGPSGIA
jgi:signal transduction histidine kinase